MMFDSINSQFQATFYKAILKLMEKYMAGTSGVTGSASSNSAALKSFASLLQSSMTLSGTASPSRSGYYSSSAKPLDSGQFSQLIQSKASQYGVDPKLVQAVVQAESAFNPNAVSSAGAEGLMQLMPATASNLGVADPLDPAQNVDGGVRLLRELLDTYNGDLSKTLAAYNAGPAAVNKYGGVPPYQETQTYVKRILSNLDTMG
jgi:soluble lytic murein transglycosylase-like protein